MKLSVYYIVRNEQEYIYSSIKSIKEIADEIIIVDTGSIDRTVEICKSFNCKIFRYRWDDDFSSVRNFAIEKCTGDYILCLNADEKIKKEDSDKIKSIIGKGKKNTVYNLVIKDFMGSWDDANFEKNVLNENYSRTNQFRLFPNFPVIKYDGKVNESIDESVNRCG